MGRDQQAQLAMLVHASDGPAEASNSCTAVLATIFFVLVFLFVGRLLLWQLIYAGPLRSRELVLLTKANMGKLTTPLELYHQKVGAYPTSLGDLCQLPAGMKQEAWGGPYVDDTNKLKDGWGREIQYRSPGVHNSQHYDLWSTGKDGEDGTDDDISNWVVDDP